MRSVSFSIFLSMNCAIFAICSSNFRFLMAIDCNDYNLSQSDYNLIINLIAQH